MLKKNSDLLRITSLISKFLNENNLSIDIKILKFSIFAISLSVLIIDKFLDLKCGLGSKEYVIFSLNFIVMSYLFKS